MHDREFQLSNQVLIGIIKTRRRNGQDVTKHKDEISDGDLHRLYTSGVLNSEEPWGLIYKTYFELSLHFARRGREGLRALRKDSFIFSHDGDGIECVTMAYNEAEKKKQGDEKNISEKKGVMCSQPGDNCPVKTLTLHISKLRFISISKFSYTSQ